MSRIFLTSDTHFGHDREFIWKVRGFSSVEEMNEEYIKRWNEVVEPDDEVYHLGDFALGDLKNVEFLNRLNGKIHLVWGNHDTETRKAYILEHCPNVVESGYALMLHYRKYHFYMSHFPSVTSNLEKENLHQATLNLYGHTHQKTNFFNDMPFMYHVGVDSHNGYPILLDTIIEDMKAEVNKCVEML